MKEFIQLLKKFLKIALIIILAFFVIGFAVSKYMEYKEQKQFIADEEFGFRCSNENQSEKYISLILESTPSSRPTANYYSMGYVVGGENSSLNETALLVLQPFIITERTIDYIYLKGMFTLQELKLNRKTLDLQQIRKDDGILNPEIVMATNQCKEVPVKDIKDFVDRKNKEAKATNKI
mgnify:FL=1